MEKSDNDIYLKFRLRDTIDIPSAFVIAKDQELLDKWDGTKDSDPHRKYSSNPPKPNHTFSDLSKAFIESIETFYRTVPFVMSRLPVLLSIEADRELRRLCKEKGTLLKQETSLSLKRDKRLELYRVSSELLIREKHRLERLESIRSGFDLIPNIFLMGLVASFDAFFSGLIRAILITKPEIISASEKNISLKDLTDLGSVEAAREMILEREVEDLMRKSHSDQIAWIETKLKLPIRASNPLWPQFIEICERRNLLTHTNGKVSDQYLRVCGEHGFDCSKRKVGDTLAVEPTYFQNSVELLFEFGVKLTQVVWRKLLPTDCESAANTLNNVAFNMIEKKRYKVASNLLQFGLVDMKNKVSESCRKTMIVNYANARKLDGDEEHSRKIIEDEDWSAASDNFKICVAAIQDNVESVLTLMKAVVSSGLITLNDLRTWPVFDKVRTDPRFIDAFEASFGEKVVIGTAAMLTTLSQSDSDAGEQITNDQGVAGNLPEEPRADSTEPLELK